MKRIIFIAFAIVIALSAVSFAAVLVKGGLSGGAGLIAISADRQVKDNLTVAGDLGYGIGSGYTLVNAGVSAKMPVRGDMYAGLAVNYSSFSSLVKMSIGPTLADKAGIGFGVVIGKQLREGIFAEVGYDTRLGAVAELGYTVRK